MIIDRKNILLMVPLELSTYSPKYMFAPSEIDYTEYTDNYYTEDEKRYIVQNYTKPDFDFKKYPLRFYWPMKSAATEKRLKSYDCFHERGGMTSGDGFFAHDRLLECWHDLIDKDLRILPSECYTKNGLVTEFHLVVVMNMVDGLDKDLTCWIPRKDTTYLREVPKATNEFMNGAQIAKNHSWSFSNRFYITPELVERTLKYLRKKEIKSAYIKSFREYWEWLYGGYVNFPVYYADYNGMASKLSE